MQAFITGSQVYGEPTAMSDVDVCVCLDTASWEILTKMADEIGGSCGDALRFGKLNLLNLSPADYVAWNEATNELAARKPVSRDEAVQVIESIKTRNRQRLPLSA